MENRLVKHKLMHNHGYLKKLETMLKGLGIAYENLDFYVQAFTHPSYANEHKVPNNERLEFLGDAILDFLVADYLYHAFPNIPEGEMSKLRSKYVCTQANAQYARELHLETSLLLGKGELEHGGKEKESVLANLFESFLGAVYLDKGVENVNKILENTIYDKIQDPLVEYFHDYKSKLQEYIQAESRNGVEYRLEHEKGPSHQKTFTVAVYHEEIKLGIGVGKSKKEAEQNAASNALHKLALK